MSSHGVVDADYGMRYRSAGAGNVASKSVESQEVNMGGNYGTERLCITNRILTYKHAKRCSYCKRWFIRKEYPDLIFCPDCHIRLRYKTRK